MGKSKDIVGQVFGYWTVESPSTKTNKAGQKYWVCRCKCGSIKEVSGTSLRVGDSVSCGCKQKEAVSNNIIGKKFGNLTVLYDSQKRDNKGHIIWVCQCDCGNIKEVTSKHLVDGGTESCGCLSHPTKDISGMRYNQLTAIEPTEKRSGSAVVWKCVCDCGNLCEVSLANLQNGHTKSCGCLMSVGEQKIKALLLENNIYFETQKMFDTCRFLDTNAMAKFDFFVDNKYLIEFDGYQHFHYNDNTWYTKEHLNDVQRRDSFKNDWCKNNNIPLIRIPYTIKDIKIEDIILETSNYIVG